MRILNQVLSILALTVVICTAEASTAVNTVPITNAGTNLATTIDISPTSTAAALNIRPCQEGMSGQGLMFGLSFADNSFRCKALGMAAFHRDMYLFGKSPKARQDHYREMNKWLAIAGNSVNRTSWLDLAAEASVKLLKIVFSIAVIGVAL